MCRRAGKSRYCAFLACYFASKDYSKFLAAGEVATVAILASDRKQARAIFRFILGFLKTSPLLADFVDDEGQETIQLVNRVRIEISTAGVNDSRTLAIGHRDGNLAILDQILEVRPPFSPDNAVAQCALWDNAAYFGQIRCEMAGCSL